MGKKKQIKVKEAEAAEENVSGNGHSDTPNPGKEEQAKPQNPGEGAASVELASVEEKLEALQQENAALQDKMLRAAAEFENFKRRRNQELERITAMATESLVEDLLPVLDDFELVLSNAKESDEMKPFLQGVSLIHKKLLETLKRRGVEAVDPKGEPFDPDLHEALMEQPSPEAEPGTVLMVHQKGYTMRGKLLRAAKVVVAAEAS